MIASTWPGIAPSAEVREFLQRHNAEAALPKFCEIVRDCFPELRDMKFRIVDDPDVDGRGWCVIEISMPPIPSQADRFARKDLYHGRVVDEMSFESAQWFALQESYAQV